MILLIKTKGHDYYDEIYSIQALNADFCYTKNSENLYSICLKPAWVSQDEARDNATNPFIVARGLSIDKVDKYIEDLNNNLSPLKLVESDGFNISFVDDKIHNVVINNLVDMQCISMIKIIPYEGDDVVFTISFAEFRQHSKDGSIYADMQKYYTKFCKRDEARKIFDQIVYGLKEADNKEVFKGTYNINI